MRVLCVCTGNTCRSPMLAALLTEALRRRGSDVTVHSAGTGAAAGDLASDGALAAMARRGLDLSTHRSTPLNAIDPAGYDRILAVTSRHAAHIRSLGIPPGRIEVVAAAQGGVPDPFGGGESEYEAAARTLASEAERIAGVLSSTA